MAMSPETNGLCHTDIRDVTINEPIGIVGFIDPEFTVAIGNKYKHRLVPAMTNMGKIRYFLILSEQLCFSGELVFIGDLFVFAFFVVMVKWYITSIVEHMAVIRKYSHMALITNTLLLLVAKNAINAPMSKFITMAVFSAIYVWYFKFLFKNFIFISSCIISVLPIPFFEQTISSTHIIFSGTWFSSVKQVCYCLFNLLVITVNCIHCI